ncbi:MAG: hypothetical protein P8188_16290 [Gemmatimonadota bacterium]
MSDETPPHSDSSLADRLPPPVFPPGSPRREALRPRGSGPLDQGTIPDEALHGPDDPVIREAPPVVPPDFDQVMRGVGALEKVMGEVTVTGMGNDPHIVPDPELEPYTDPHVAELAAALERLRHGLASRGEAALKVDARMSRFEATLRAYCVGYLAGRRAQNSHLPPER